MEPMKRGSVLYNIFRSIEKGCQFGSLIILPQDDVVDVYLMVRLGAGTLHLTIYPILVTVYILGAKVCKII